MSLPGFRGPRTGAGDGPPPDRIAVLGLGNVLMGDDGFGPHVVKRLAAGWTFPAHVRVEDVGTPGLDLTPYVSDVDALIVVDTVHAAGDAGTVRRWRKPELLRHAPPQRVSPHDPGVREVLFSLDFEGRGPREVLLVGAIPASTEMGTGLTPALRGAVEPAMNEVLRELARLGSPAAPRPEPLEPDLWWEDPEGAEVRAGAMRERAEAELR